ncbi:hypothetical protein RUND412_010470 [Rhizina undulata]
MSPPTLHPRLTTTFPHLAPHPTSRAANSYPPITTSHPTCHPTCFASSVSPASATTAPTSVDPSPIIPASTDSHDWMDLSPTEIDSCDLTTLRAKLTLANSLVKNLSASLSSIRTTAAHYSLQHKLLLLEMSEAAARRQVESDITRREIEVLKQNNEDTQARTSVTEENERYKRLLRKAKYRLRAYKEELRDIKDENKRLKKRIRENRMHQLELSKSPVTSISNPSGSAPKEPPIQQPSSVITNGIPSREDNRRLPTTAATEEDEGDRLAALGYLASQVLSHRIEPSSDNRNTTPRKLQSPPLMSHHANPAPPPPRELLSPVAFTTRHKRRQSRDSTISVSDKSGRDSPPPVATLQPNPVFSREYSQRMYLPQPQSQAQAGRTLLPPISPKRQYTAGERGNGTPRKRVVRTPPMVREKRGVGTPESPPRNGVGRGR